MVLRKNLTDDQRVMLKDYLLERLANGELPRGTLKAAAVEFSVTRQTCSRLWQAWGVALATALNGEWDVKSGKKGSGCGLKYNRDDVAQAVRDLPLRQRSTVRLLEGALAISKSTVHRLIREEKILRSHRSTVKPMLTDVNKLHRLDFCLEERAHNGLFKEMYDRIHVDEKFFHLTKEVQRYILAEGEENPHRTVSHKSHIPKVMFMAANARPRWDAGRNQLFHGKVGMWPIARQVPAQRSSRHRVAGTLEWKSYSMTKETYMALIFEQLVPAILQNWPRANRHVLIQQDNATPHITPNEFRVLWLERKVELQNACSIDETFGR
jgi:hypothetical protein